MSVGKERSECRASVTRAGEETTQRRPLHTGAKRGLDALRSCGRKPGGGLPWFELKRGWPNGAKGVCGYSTAGSKRRKSVIAYEK